MSALFAYAQVVVVVDSFQLDNQLLETLRPVVLSPHEVGECGGDKRDNKQTFY